MNRKGFTLVELLVVVGIMAGMGTLSIGSYFAVVRGMTDRSAIAAATSIISMAQERACIDLVPTAVYFYNEVVQREDENKGRERIVSGVAVAVRRAGRITCKVNDIFGDEFADFDRTYGAVDDENRLKGDDAFLLYRFNRDKMEYSSVYSLATEYQMGIDSSKFLVESPIDDWRKEFKKNEEYSKNGKSDEEEPQDALMAYMFKKSGSDSVQWKVGDAYAYEFARVRLPNNYIFGSSRGDAPTDTERIKKMDSLTILCKPGISASESEISDRVNIVCKPAFDGGAWRKVGSTLKKMEDI